MSGPFKMKGWSPFTQKESSKGGFESVTMVPEIPAGWFSGTGFKTEFKQLKKKKKKKKNILTSFTDFLKSKK